MTNNMENRKQKPSAIKICAFLGVIFFAATAISAYRDLNSLGKNDRQIAVIVKGNAQGIDFPVEFNLNGAMKKANLQSTQIQFKKGDEVKVWITDDDPNSIQLKKPSYEILRNIYIYYVGLNIFLFVAAIISLLYKPSVACVFFVLSIVLPIISRIISWVIIKMKK